jgi:hypothetical protein
MRTKDEALKQALAALDIAAYGLYKATPHFDTHKMIEQVEAAITAIKQALAASDVADAIRAKRKGGDYDRYESNIGHMFGDKR